MAAGELPPGAGSGALSFPDSEVRKTEIGGKPAGYYEMLAETPEGEIHQRQIFTIDGKTVYALTFSVLPKGHFTSTYPRWSRCSVRGRGNRASAMAQDNVEIVRGAWEAWLRGDMDALVAMWDPEIVWDTTNFHDWPESSYRGPDDVRQFLSEWLEMWGDYEIDIDDVLGAPDGRVVSLIRQRGRGRHSGLEDRAWSWRRSSRCEMARSFGSTITTDREEALKAAGLNEEGAG